MSETASGSKPTPTSPNSQQPTPEPSIPATNTAIPNGQTVDPALGSSLAHGSLNEDRSQLIIRARSFLQSPQVHNQDLDAKRRFLAEKGLNSSEIDGLLRELPPQFPYVPPRTYPQLPPSSLPNLLLGLARLFTWISGGSAILIFAYYRYLLPRITQTLVARNSLKSYHLSLMCKLTTSLSALKESQTEAFSILPRPEPYQEHFPFVQCKSVSDILKEVSEEGDVHSIPSISLLRCAITDFKKRKEEIEIQATTEDLFHYLEGCIPWLLTEDGLKYERLLWETLTSCPLFQEIEETMEQGKSLPPKWTYMSPTPAPPSPVVQSLDTLSSSLPRTKKGRPSPFQHVLQTLSDFTGYISGQVYLPFRPNIPGLPGNSTLNPVEEEIRREIRAIKGLLLNRRSFMPSIPRGIVPHRPATTT